MAKACLPPVQVVTAGLITSTDFWMVRLEARLAIGNLLSLSFCLPLGMRGLEPGYKADGKSLY